MLKKNQEKLCGLDNKRLDQSDPTNNEGTAAWANVAKLQKQSNVSIPSDENVKNAKEWVDNGSRL